MKVNHIENGRSEKYVRIKADVFDKLRILLEEDIWCSRAIR